MGFVIGTWLTHCAESIHNACNKALDIVLRGIKWLYLKCKEFVIRFCKAWHLAAKEPEKGEWPCPVENNTDHIFAKEGFAKVNIATARRTLVALGYNSNEILTASDEEIYDKILNTLSSYGIAAMLVKEKEQANQ